MLSVLTFEKINMLQCGDETNMELGDDLKKSRKAIEAQVRNDINLGTATLLKWRRNSSPSRDVCK
jgi:hypothetical protein